MIWQRRSIAVSTNTAAIQRPCAAIARPRDAHDRANVAEPTAREHGVIAIGLQRELERPLLALTLADGLRQSDTQTSQIRIDAHARLALGSACIRVERRCEMPLRRAADLD